MAGNYAAALALYDEALEKEPTDKENLYRRGMCKKNLNNIKGALEDWQKVKELGGDTVDVLLEKYGNKN
jgi:tetratricopeptide (TPR) repeat protein